MHDHKGESHAVARSAACMDKECNVFATPSSHVNNWGSVSVTRPGEYHAPESGEYCTCTHTVAQDWERWVGETHLPRAKTIYW